MSTVSRSPGTDWRAGFTLIELLVTVAIGLLLVGVGVAGFVDFNERQKILNSGLELATVFQTAQVKAQAGDLAGCTELSEYRVSFDTAVNPVVVTLTPVCAGVGPSTGTFKTYVLGAGVTLAMVPSGAVAHFSALNQTVSFVPASSSLAFTLGSAAVAKTYHFTLGQGGDISDGYWQ